MTPRSRTVFALLGLTAFTACGRAAPTADTALKHDLDLVGGGGIELAPQGNAKATISADELIPAGNRARTAPARVAAKSKRPEQPAATRAPETVATSPAPTAPAPDSAVTSAPATRRPLPADAVSPPPPGGYKSMGELIRKAPFPINP